MAGRRLLALLVIAAIHSIAVQAEGIESFLKGREDLTVTAKFVELADADAIFGDSPSAGIVLFAASDAAWATAAEKLGINIDPATASKADGEKLGSIMMYNMISGAGVSVGREGSPEGLLEKQSIQSLLGAAYQDNLPIEFTGSSDSVVAKGLASGNQASLSQPLQKGKSLVYLTDTVLLPSDSASAIPVPDAKRRKSL